MRLGEALALRWDDLDFGGRRIRVARGLSRGVVGAPKNGRGRSIDMSLALRDGLLRHELEGKAEWLEKGQPMPAWVFVTGEGTLLDRLPVENPGAVDRLDDAFPDETGGRVAAAQPSRRPRPSQVVDGAGGPRGARTRGLLIANQALSQLS